MERVLVARKQNKSNGHLEEALALLIQNQASFLARATEMDRRFAETDRQNAERFARIEKILLEHSQILANHSRILQEHTRLLEALPEAIRDKIGFKAPPKA
jgi:hypothetical protein